MDHTEVLEPPLIAVVNAMRSRMFETWLSDGADDPYSQIELPNIALVFTDVVGSTNLLFELGDDAYDLALENHFSRARELIESHQGLEIDTAGDGFFCAFKNVADAIQYALALSAEPGDSRIGIRAGIHYGETKFRKTSFCGRTVHFASRVMSQAVGPEIWLSDRAVQELKACSFDLPPMESFASCSLKNIPGAWQLWRVRIDATPK